MKLVHALVPLVFAGLGTWGCGSFGPYAGVMAQPGGAAPGGAAATAPSAPSGTEPAASTLSSPSTPAPTAGPVSVSIRSSCPKTVKVFFGQKPKFGSGTYSTASSNSVSSHSFQPGEMLWIVDEHENGVASVTVQAATREIEIRASCTELASH